MRASFEWPFAVAKLLGRCLEIRSAVKPGQEEKKTLVYCRDESAGHRAEDSTVVKNS